MTILGKKRKKGKKVKFKEKEFTTEIQAVLTEVCESLDIDPDDYSTWGELLTHLVDECGVNSDTSDLEDLVDTLAVAAGVDEDEEDDADEEDDDDEFEDDDDEDDDEDDEDEEDDDEDGDEDEEDDDEDDDEDDEESGTGFVVGAKAIKKELERDAARNATQKRPMLWLKDGEDRDVRFRDEEPLCLVKLHRFKLGNKWTEKVCTADIGGCEYCRSGIGTQATLVYEVIDRTGYKDKKGTRVKNKACFLHLTNKRHKQLQMLQRKAGSLVKFDINISREGTGTDTTYSFVPGRPKKRPEDKKILRLKKELAKYYAPESQKVQRSVLGGYSAAAD